MPNFVYDFTLLSGSKTDLIPLDPGDDPSKYCQAENDWNPLISAVNDIRVHTLSASFIGLAHLTGGLGANQRPSVSGSRNFLFLSSSNDVFLHRAGGGDYRILTGALADDADSFGTAAFRYREVYARIHNSHTSSLTLSSSVNQLPGDNPNHIISAGNSFASDQAAKILDIRLAGIRVGYIDHSGSICGYHNMSLQTATPSGTFGIGATGSWAIQGGDEGGLIDLDSTGAHFPNTSVPFFTVSFAKPYPTGSQVFVTISPNDATTAAQGFGGAGTRALYVSGTSTGFGIGTSLAVGSPVNWFINYTVKCITPR